MAPRIEDHKALIAQLYKQKRWTPGRIAKHMSENYDGMPDDGATYREALKKWGIRKKNRKGKSNGYGWADYQRMIRTSQHKKTRWLVHGAEVDNDTMNKEISRNVPTWQQHSYTTAPETPEGWVAVTPSDAPTPAAEPPSHEMHHDEQKTHRTIERTDVDLLEAPNDNTGLPNIPPEFGNLNKHGLASVHIKTLVDTMVDCGTFITIFAAEALSMDHATLLARYSATANSILAAQREDPSELISRSPEFLTAFEILRTTFFNDGNNLKKRLDCVGSMFHADILRTALFLSCKGGQSQAANTLLSHGVSPDSRDTKGVPCLVVAVRSNSESVVRLLLESGANVNLADRLGETAWTHICQSREHEHIALMLSGAGVKKNFNKRNGHNTMYVAAAGGHADNVRTMIERGMDPSFATAYRWEPLHWAASNGHLEVVKILVEAGANINPVSDQRKTPLDMTSRSDIHEYLVSHGARNVDKSRYWSREQDIIGLRSSSDEGYFDSDDMGYLSDSESEDAGDPLEMHHDEDCIGDMTDSASASVAQMHIHPQIYGSYYNSSSASAGETARSSILLTSQSATQAASPLTTSSSLHGVFIGSPSLVSRYIYPSASPAAFYASQSPYLRQTSHQQTPMMTASSLPELSLESPLSIRRFFSPSGSIATMSISGSPHLQQTSLPQTPPLANSIQVQQDSWDSPKLPVPIW